MNPFEIVGGEIRSVEIPLKTPFVTALGRKTSTKNIQIRLLLKGGAKGFGEASGSVVMAHQSPGKRARTLGAMLAKFRGRSVDSLGPLVRSIWKGYGRTPSAAAAFECAATEALTAGLGVRLSDWFGGSQTRIESDCTLSADSAGRTSAAARRAAEDGFSTLKVKVGRGGPKADLERVRIADREGRRRGKRPRIILDGNQKLTAAAALKLVEACLKSGVRVILLEQPVARAGLIKDLAILTKRSPVPVAADESVRSATDALRLIDAGAADVFNVKVAKTGLQESLNIIAIARAAGKGLMIGCMQESALGLSASVHLACGTGAFDFVDLDSDYLLDSDQPRGNFRRDGAILSL